jgi:hypothetical protein
MITVRLRPPNVRVEVTVPDDCWVPHPGLVGVATVVEVDGAEVDAAEVAVLDVDAAEVDAVEVVEVVVVLDFDPPQAVNNRDMATTAVTAASARARLTALCRPIGDVPSPFCCTARLL